MYAKKDIVKGLRKGKKGEKKKEREGENKRKRDKDNDGGNT